MLGEDALIYNGKGILADCMYSVDDWRAESMIEHIDRLEGIHFKSPLLIPNVTHEGTYYCGFTGNWRNYGHWMTECLPRLYLFKSLQRYVCNIKILLPNFSNESIQSATLDLVGIRDQDIRRIRAGELFRSESVWTSSAIHVWGLPTMCRQAANWLSSAAIYGEEFANSEQSSFVYIRRNSEFRRLVNFDDLLPILSAFGFRIVQMEKLDLKEQIRTMRRARVVIAESSAGLANSIFCQPGTIVLELFNPANPQPAHWVIASLFELKYGFLVGKHVPTELFPVPEGNSAYEIAPTKLKDTIWRLFTEDNFQKTFVASPVPSNVPNGNN